MIKLELEINEVNTILAVLGKHPFEEVANLVVKIKPEDKEKVKEVGGSEEARGATNFVVENSWVFFLLLLFFLF